MDVHIAYRRACLNAIEYLEKFGYTGEQAYLLPAVLQLKAESVESLIFPMPAARLQYQHHLTDILPC